VITPRRKHWNCAIGTPSAIAGAKMRSGSIAAILRSYQAFAEFVGRHPMTFSATDFDRGVGCGMANVTIIERLE
jgi:hypothetical protein